MGQGRSRLGTPSRLPVVCTRVLSAKERQAGAAHGWLPGVRSGAWYRARYVQSPSACERCVQESIVSVSKLETEVGTGCGAVVRPSACGVCTRVLSTSARRDRGGAGRGRYVPLPVGGVYKDCCCQCQQGETEVVQGQGVVGTSCLHVEGVYKCCCQIRRDRGGAGLGSGTSVYLLEVCTKTVVVSISTGETGVVQGQGEVGTSCLPVECVQEWYQQGERERWCRAK